MPWPEKQWKTLPLKSLARKTKITHHLCCETVLSSSWKHAWQSKLFVSLDLEPHQVKVLTTEKDEAKCRLKSGWSPFKNRKRNWRTNWVNLKLEICHAISGFPWIAFRCIKFNKIWNFNDCKIYETGCLSKQKESLQLCWVTDLIMPIIIFFLGCHLPFL